jgi:hypothetical protein
VSASGGEENARGRRWPGDDPAEPAGPPRRSGMAIAALVLGVLSIPLSLTVYLGVLAGLAAVILGTVGLVATRRGRMAGRGMALAGLITGLVGLVIAVSLGAYGLKTFRDCQHRIGHRPSSEELRDCARTGV